jgi:hypothetical protein
LLPTGPARIRRKLREIKRQLKKLSGRLPRKITRRIELLVALPFDKLDALRLEAETKAIGEAQG